MTKFTGDSFRVTPLKWFNDDQKKEDLEFIKNILNEKRFDSEKIPSYGWLSFQTAKGKNIESEIDIDLVKLPNENTIVPCTMIQHVLDISLKARMKPSEYEKLSDYSKYRYEPFDIIFFKEKNKLFSLISSNNKNTISGIESDYLKDKPFSDFGFTFETNPNEFKIPSDLIHWILYRIFKKGQIINERIKINDTYLVEGKLKVPINLKYEGDDLEKYLIELKCSICQERPFDKIGIKLNFNTYLFEFCISGDGCIDFYGSDCEYLNIEDESIDNLSKLIFIYTAIVPEIKSAYVRDKTNWAREKKEFLKSIGQDVVDSINRLTKPIEEQRT